MLSRVALLVLVAGFGVVRAEPAVTIPSPPAATAPAPQPAVIEPARDGFEDHHGVTFEANLGVGFARMTNVTREGDSQNGRAAPAGLCLGIGGFLTRQLALSFRLGGVAVRIPDLAAGYYLDGFYGAVVQYWLRPDVWVGGGIGFALFGVNKTGCNTDDGKCIVPGWGFDLRAGYTFAKSGRHTANVSVEITPEMYSDRVHSWSATGFGLLLGYQFL